jgi:hypothetical protein
MYALRSGNLKYVQTIIEIIQNKRFTKEMEENLQSPYLNKSIQNYEKNVLLSEEQ